MEWNMHFFPDALMMLKTGDLRRFGRSSVTPASGVWFIFNKIGPHSNLHEMVGQDIAKFYYMFGQRTNFLIIFLPRLVV
jgi:hypothetical protein